jgi:MoxR-like ATPase
MCGACRGRWEGAKTEMSTLEQVTGQARRELAKVIVGQAEMVDLLLLTIVCGGHALLEGVPGLAKTLAIRALSRIMRLQFQRVQCTPDLMPADIVGANVFNLGTSAFTLHQGPVFTDLLLVDEINRMPPRTQAALLEAMEERQVTIDGTSHRLSPAFTTFATQNPIEFEGTYPLPEAELDRFLVKIRLGYPDRAGGEEEAILERHHRGFDARAIDDLVLEPLDMEQLAVARKEVQAVAVEAPLFTYIAAIARRSREWPSLTLGVSPRGAIHLMQLAKAMAAMDARDFLLPDDVKRAAPPVFRHRLILRPEADLEGLTADQITADILAAVEVPR